MHHPMKCQGEWAVCQRLTLRTRSAEGYIEAAVWFWQQGVIEGKPSARYSIQTTSTCKDDALYACRCQPGCKFEHWCSR